MVRFLFKVAKRTAWMSYVLVNGTRGKSIEAGFDWLKWILGKNAAFSSSNRSKAASLAAAAAAPLIVMAAITASSATAAAAAYSIQTLQSSPFSKRLLSPSKTFKILAMAPKKKVNRYDQNWEKTWYGAGIFTEGSEEVEIDVFKKLEKKKVLSNVEKAGLLSKAEGLGFTLSSIEKLGFFSKAEELGLLSLLESVASSSPSALASVALPLLVAAIATVVLIPDDSAALVAVQAIIAAAFGVGAAGLFVGSVVLGGLQESD